MSDTTTRPLAGTTGPGATAGTTEAPPAVLTATAIAVGVVTVMALLLGLLAHAMGPAAPAAASAAPSATAAPAAPSATSAPAAPSATSAPAVTSAPAAPLVQEPTAPAPEAPESGTTAPPTARTHTVVSGETLAGIAVRYQVPSELIAADNGLVDPDDIRAGQALAITVPPTDVDVIAPGTTLGEYAHDHGTTVAALRALNPQITDADRIQAGRGLRIARS